MVNNELLNIIMIFFFKKTIDFDLNAPRCESKTSKIVECLIKNFSALSKKESSLPLLDLKYGVAKRSWFREIFREGICKLILIFK